MNLEEKAFQFAKAAHIEQKDLASADYFSGHILMVVKKIELLTDNPKILAVGYLHDVLEDTATTPEDLLMIFPEDVVTAVKAITREKGESYFEYLKRVKSNEWATTVKLVDLKNNMDLSRIKNPVKRDFDRLEKYKKAFQFLKDE